MTTYITQQIKDTDLTIRILRDQAAACRTYGDYDAWVGEVKDCREFLNGDIRYARKRLKDMTDNVVFWEGMFDDHGNQADLDRAIRYRAQREQLARELDQLLAQRQELTEGLRAYRAYVAWADARNHVAYEAVCREHTEAQRLVDTYGDMAQRVACELRDQATDEDERRFWSLTEWRIGNGTIDHRFVKSAN